MDQTYDNRKRADSAVKQDKTASGQPSLDALRSGAVMPTREQMGHRVDLPSAMREKMENAFGADFSAVSLYESQTVADAGAAAMTQGTNIAFAPGMLDFTSFGGQSLLGHELSHVVSQSRNEARGSGFLSDPALEAKADREGAMAAAGQTVAPPGESLSPISAAPAESPMQAGWKKPKDAQQAPEAGSAPQADAGQQATAAPPTSAVQQTAPEPQPEPEPQPGPAPAQPAPPPGPAPAHLQPPEPEPPAGAVQQAGAAPQQAQPAAKTSAWDFTSSPGEERQFPTNGVGFLLGMNNLEHPDPRHRYAFMSVLRGMKGLAVVSGNRRHVGGQASYDAMLGNAYAGAIDGLEKYRQQLVEEYREDASSMSRAEASQRIEHLKLVADLISRARHDQAVNMRRRVTTLTNDEHVSAGGAGAMNEVHKFQRGEDGNKETAYFKPTLPDSQRTREQLATERYVMDRIGVKHHDAEGKAVDPRLSKREVAYSRLSSLMGSSVGIGAKLARYKPDSQHRALPGVLMEEAKGKEWDEFNWRYFGPVGDTNYTSLDPAVDSDTIPGNNWGERLGDTPIIGKHTTAHENVKDAFGIEDDAPELDAADPDYQQQMNEMFLLDTLATHTDRHMGNFKVNRDENGKISVKTLDNDITFGSLGSETADKTAFGKRGDAPDYGGLPTMMQIDANMAKRIRGMKKEMLYKTFSDLLSKDEIESLWSRFEMMKEYVDSMEKADPSLIVRDWNEQTAIRETALAGGAFSHDREDLDNPGGYSGNNYYQRQMMMLHAADSENGANGEEFIYYAMGRTARGLEKKRKHSGPVPAPEIDEAFLDEEEYRRRSL